MRVLFWLSFAVIVYTYAGYPFVIALLARLRPRPWRREPWPSASPAPISVVMAVSNGGLQLEPQVEHLLALDPALVAEIIIVSDGSTDQTNAILSRQHTSRLKSILLSQRAGKSAAVNHGILVATGEILLFVDLRPRIRDGALTSLLANFADPKVGCVAGELLLTTAAQDGAASAVSGLYWRYEQWIRNCEAVVHSPVGVYGGFYAIRRALATQAPQGLILDDMFQPLHVVRQGYRSVVDRSARVVDSWPPHAAGEFRRKVRTLAGNFQLIGCAPWLLTFKNRLLFQLLSHKLLRLVVPYFFAILLVTSAVLGSQSLPFAVFAAAQAAFWLMAALALKWHLPLIERVASPAGALLMLNAAAVVGLYTFLFTRGPLWKIWTPTQMPPAGTFAASGEPAPE